MDARMHTQNMDCFIFQPRLVGQTNSNWDYSTIRHGESRVHSVIKSHCTWNLDSRPRKVMAFRKMFSDDGKVMEFDGFIVIIFESVVDKNKWIFGTFYRTLKSFLKRVSYFPLSLKPWDLYQNYGKVMEFHMHVSEWTLVPQPCSKMASTTNLTPCHSPHSHFQEGALLQCQWCDWSSHCNQAGAASFEVLSQLIWPAEGLATSHAVWAPSPQLEARPGNPGARCTGHYLRLAPYFPRTFSGLATLVPSRVPSWAKGFWCGPTGIAQLSRSS